MSNKVRQIEPELFVVLNEYGHETAKAIRITKDTYIWRERMARKFFPEIWARMCRETFRQAFPDKEIVGGWVKL